LQVQLKGTPISGGGVGRRFCSEERWIIPKYQDERFPGVDAPEPRNIFSKCKHCDEWRGWNIHSPMSNGIHYMSDNLNYLLHCFSVSFLFASRPLCMFAS